MKDRQRNRIGSIILLLGILLVVLGAIRGEMATVFLKATNICLECIGIG